jgi:arginine decarboxylase
VTRSIVGWESERPVPDGHRFTDFLQVRHGELYFDDLNLNQLFSPRHPEATGPMYPAAGDDKLPTPLETIHLSMIERRIRDMERAFRGAAADVGYDGAFLYAYASKANAAEEVIRTTLRTGAHHEMSSAVDVDIVHYMKERGFIPDSRIVMCNGFKESGSEYAEKLLAFRAEHERLMPIIEDLTEIEPFESSESTFDVGLRLKSYGKHASVDAMDRAHSRFGMSQEDLRVAAKRVESAENLRFVLFHCMVGSQLVDRNGFVDALIPGIDTYVELRKRYPTLHMFDFGGGIPARMTLDFEFDYRAMARRLLSELKQRCDAGGVPVPDVVGEFGRYTTSEHGSHLFTIINVKENRSDRPWYLIDGSIMSSFPDCWALDEHFIVLPLNHLDKPFRRVELGGITCDSDDVYPPHGSESPLYLPVETEGLRIGFFGIGAYQEMLGGVRGSKHCVLPEGFELIIDTADDGRPAFTLVPGQTIGEVLFNLGYR